MQKKPHAAVQKVFAFLHKILVVQIIPRADVRKVLAFLHKILAVQNIPCAAEQKIRGSSRKIPAALCINGGDIKKFLVTLHRIHVGSKKSDAV